jgi:hypothetical protein
MQNYVENLKVGELLQLKVGDFGILELGSFFNEKEGKNLRVRVKPQFKRGN